MIPNIGPCGRRLRRIIGIASFAVAAIGAALLIALDLHRGWRVLLFAPLWLGSLGLVQARASTCVYLAARCVRNMDSGDVPVVDATELRAIAHQARRVRQQSLAIAAVLTAALVAMPS